MEVGGEGGKCFQKLKLLALKGITDRIHNACDSAVGRRCVLRPQMVLAEKSWIFTTHPPFLEK